MVDPKEFDDLFDNAAQGQLDLDQWIISKESGYEERMVKLVMTKLGLVSNISAVKQEVKEWLNDAEAKISFDWFHNVYPTFPVRLCAKSYVKAYEMTLADLYKRFTTMRMYKAFMENAELHQTHPKNSGGQLESLGLIFPLNGLGQMIIHNVSLEIPGTRISRVFANKQIVYLDILPNFLEAIAQRWSP